MGRRAILVFLLTGLGALGSACSPEDAPRYVPGSTVKRFQRTGDEDRPRRVPTRTRTGQRAGVFATDLG